MDGCEKYECTDFNRINKFLPELKNKKSKVKDIVIEKYKNMNEYPDFEQDYYSLTAKGVYINEHDSTQFMKWIAFYDGYYENINYSDLLACVLSILSNEESLWKKFRRI